MLCILSKRNCYVFLLLDIAKCGSCCWQFCRSELKHNIRSCNTAIATNSDATLHCCRLHGFHKVRDCRTTHKHQFPGKEPKTIVSCPWCLEHTSGSQRTALSPPPLPTLAYNALPDSIALRTVWRRFSLYDVLCHCLSHMRMLPWIR